MKEITITERIDQLLKELTVEEKIRLCSGSDQWHTEGIERLGLPKHMVSDGPHGLRKQLCSEGFGVGESTKATCFPTASLMACSFDTDLVNEVGKQLGRECIEQDVQVILGPGVNMKRSPLCGRNFEYFSEDPYLAGNIAAAWINGVQSNGVGTSMKHFAANNQERRRMNVSATIDERALHEYYLRGFEIAVKKSNPLTLMCSYNRINEVYSSENYKLLTEILRDRWGYDGLVMSDWGATHKRPQGIKAGLNLEMPGSNGYCDQEVRDALESGELTMEELDTSVACVLKFILKLAEEKTMQAVSCEAHDLAVRAARESMVLLKNEGSILPLDGKVTVFGDFFTVPRYQGAGSSKVTPKKLDTPMEAFDAAKVDYTYHEGYNSNDLEGITSEDKLVIFAGLTEKFESEGFDRDHMKMPANQNEFIDEAIKTGAKIAVVLIGGAPIDLPWADSVDGILLAYLGGEGMGTAVTQLLIGEYSPCGKLAETWPFTADDAACADNFPGDRLHSLYKESIYCGYRYYDTFDVPVRYSFGHGLSYTSFEYSDAACTNHGDCITVTFKVANTGAVAARETSMVFVKHNDGTAFMPKHQLVGFSKNHLEAGETKEVSIKVNVRDLGYYNTKINDYYIPSGEYALLIGGSLDNLVLGTTVNIESEAKPEIDYRGSAGCYYSSLNDSLSINDSEFEVLYGSPIPEKAAKAVRPFTEDNCLEDTTSTLPGKMVMMIMDKYMANVSEAEKEQEAMMLATVREMPLFALAMSSGGIITKTRLAGLIDMMNGHYVRGLSKMIKK